jgi:CubicO group peptidase (beta-lactamase class C family)
MRLMLMSLTCLLLFAAACTKHASANAHTATQAQSTVKALLDALNSKDKEKILAFVKSHCSEKMQSRAGRMVEVSEMGAPFKLLTVKENGNEVEANLEDVNGVPVSLKMTIAAGKIEGMMMRAGGPGPMKDYSGWIDLAKLEETIRSDTQSPAMAIGILYSGKTEAVASGVREIGKPAAVKADDVFSIGSIGKPITSTLIGLLVEKGKLRWDETLSEVLPDMAMKPEYSKVTLEQILHHRGGIPQDLGMRKPQVDKIVQGETDPVKIRDNFSRDILSRDPIGKPGERFAYSNAGYQLLGHIAELKMGKPFEILVQEMIFKPLGMTHTYTGRDTLPIERPSGHVQGDGPRITGNRETDPETKPADPQTWRPVNFTGPLEILFAPAGGGMYSTTKDLLKFGQMHMDGLNGKDGLLKAATIQRLHQGIPEGAVAESGATAKATELPEGSMLYACGWGIESFPGTEVMHTHNGSNGTMRAQLAIFPKSGLVVAAFVNCGGEMEPSPPLLACIAIARRYATG